MSTTADYLNDLKAQQTKLAEIISSKGVEAEPTELLNSLVPKVNDVYNKGLENGNGGSYDEGFEAGTDNGKAAERKAIFGAWQNKGKRTNYNYACYLVPLIDNYFYPQHDIKPTEMTQMFRGCTAVNQDKGFDLVKRLNECGVTLNTHNCTAFSLAFGYARLCTIPTIDFSAVYNKAAVGNTFLGCVKVQTIEKVIFTEILEYSQTFNECTNLKNLTAEGTIANTINFSWSPLTAESAKSIIRCLKNCVGADDEYANTIYFSETTKTLLDAEGNTSPSGGTWFEYINEMAWNYA